MCSSAFFCVIRVSFVFKWKLVSSQSRVSCASIQSRVYLVLHSPSSSVQFSTPCRRWVLQLQPLCVIHNAITRGKAHRVQKDQCNSHSSATASVLQQQLESKQFSTSNRQQASRSKLQQLQGSLCSEDKETAFSLHLSRRLVSLVPITCHCFSSTVLSQESSNWSLSWKLLVLFSPGNSPRVEIRDSVESRGRPVAGQSKKKRLFYSPRAKREKFQERIDALDKKVFDSDFSTNTYQNCMKIDTQLRLGILHTPSKFHSNRRTGSHENYIRSSECFKRELLHSINKFSTSISQLVLVRIAWNSTHCFVTLSSVLLSNFIPIGQLEVKIFILERTIALNLQF